MTGAVMRQRTCGEEGDVFGSHCMRCGVKMGGKQDGTATPAYRHVVDGHAHCSVVVDLLRGHALSLVRQEDAQQQQQPLEAIKYPWAGEEPRVVKQGCPTWLLWVPGSPLGSLQCTCVPSPARTPNLACPPPVLPVPPQSHPHPQPCPFPTPLSPPHAHRATCSSWWSCNAPAGGGWRRPCPSWAPPW